MLRQRIVITMLWIVFIGALATSCGVATAGKAVTAAPSASSHSELPTPTNVPTSGRVVLLSNYDVTLTPGFDLTFQNQVTWSYVQAFFDFDENKIINDQGADIYLFDGCGTDCSNRVIAINGARTVLQLGNKQEPGYQGCLKLLQGDENPIGIDTVLGTYSCLRTNENNIVQILAVENMPAWKNSKFVFDYQLWHLGQEP